MAPVGRWQNGKDLSWYTKKGDAASAAADAEARRAELAAVKAAEQRMMNEAL